MLELHNHAKSLGVLFSPIVVNSSRSRVVSSHENGFPPTPWAKRGNSIVSMYGVLLGLKVICGQAKNIL